MAGNHSRRPFSEYARNTKPKYNQKPALSQMPQRQDNAGQTKANIAAVMQQLIVASHIPYGFRSGKARTAPVTMTKAKAAIDTARKKGYLGIVLPITPYRVSANDCSNRGSRTCRLEMYDRSPYPGPDTVMLRESTTMILPAQYYTFDIWSKTRLAGRRNRPMLVIFNIFVISRFLRGAGSGTRHRPCHANVTLQGR